MESERGDTGLSAADGGQAEGVYPVDDKGIDAVRCRRCCPRNDGVDSGCDAVTTALRHAESELRLASVALMSAQEIERKRIANELHDSVGQALGSLRFGIGIALGLMRSGNSGGAETMLENLSAQCKHAVDDVRRIAMDLRPSTLDDLGIVGTLAWFFREFRNVHPTLTVITDIDVSEADVPSNLTVPIYRIVQEACSNVVRHSGASEVQVCLRRRPDAILLQVADNGRGIGGDAPRDGMTRQGMGLRSMRDRVEGAGGRFHLESDRGIGTRIIADWPCAAAAGRTPGPDQD